MLCCDNLPTNHSPFPWRDPNAPEPSPQLVDLVQEMENNVKKSRTKIQQYIEVRCRDFSIEA